MTYQLIQVTRTFNRRGDVVATSEIEVATFSDPVALLRASYAIDPKLGYSISLTNKQSVTLDRRLDGAKIDFADIFLTVEGQEAYDDVFAGRRPGQVEKEWTAARA